MGHHSIMRSLAFAGMIATAGVAWAGDGRLEINQACIAAGCFAGDAAGYPVETQAGKSYVLTSSLAIPTADVRAITLAERAVLDLNGFEIAGPTTCTGIPVACPTPSTGDGVYAQDLSTIRNGTIRGMGRYGVAGEVGVTVENMVILNNASTGIYLNYGNDGPEAHLIRASRILRNGGAGILNAAGQGGLASQITDCVISGNSSYGMFLSHTLVTNNSVSRNGQFGLGGSDNGFALNHFTYNNGGNDQAQTSGGTQLGSNFCGNDAVCP